MGKFEKTTMIGKDFGSKETKGKEKKFRERREDSERERKEGVGGKSSRETGGWLERERDVAERESVANEREKEKENYR